MREGSPVTAPPSEQPHLYIHCEDATRARNWYIRVLGLTEDLSCGSQRLLLIDWGKDNYVPICKSPQLHVRTPDIHSAYADLQTRGVTPVDTIHPCEDGLLAFHIKDSEGNLIRILHE